MKKLLLLLLFIPLVSFGQDVKVTVKKEKLKEHIETVIDSLDVDSYTEDQKLKYLSTVLPYVVSKQKAVAIDNDLPDLPLFLDDLPKEVSKHLKEKWYNQVKFVE